MRLLLELIAGAAAGAAMAFILLGWAYGCGETYFDADGRQHTYDCPFTTE